MLSKHWGAGRAVALTVACLVMPLCTRVHAHSDYVDYVPNGIVWDCRTCHNSSSGGSRNAFGQDVQAILHGRIFEFWGPAIANVDSDGDGFTNGVELQDPNGAWALGDPDPGNPDLVTRPGLATSFPPTPTPTLSPTPTPTPPPDTPSPTPSPSPTPDFAPPAEIRDFLLGLNSSPDRKDHNADGGIDIADLLLGLLS